jgi:integrase
MPRPKSLTPKYRRHKPSGQAVVRINGHDHYLGEHGSQESRERYAVLMADYLTVGRIPDPEPEPDRGQTVDAVIAAYWQHIEQNGRYTKSGEPTSERSWIRDSLKPLSDLFGATPAAEFGPKKMHALRNWVIEATVAKGRKLARSTINSRMRRVVMLFRWAVGMELVPSSVWHGLQAVPGLRKGETTRVKESKGVRAVPWVDVAAALEHLSPEVAAMVELQWLTGMRPGEVRTIRGRDIDRSDKVWIYRPSSHKNEHHELDCERMVGPRAQRVLAKFLKADPDAYLFSPQEVEQNRMLARREGRVHKLWPSHERRYRDDPPSYAGEIYTTHSYRQAIHRACKAAKVPQWSPNQLRHSRATEVRRVYGLEAAQVTLGHATADVTQVYAERDRELARRVALETG